MSLSSKVAFQACPPNRATPSQLWAAFSQEERWCGRSDLNRHGLPHWLLRPACLPISSRPRIRSAPVAVCSSKSIAKVKGCSSLALLLVLAIGVTKGNDPVKHELFWRRVTVGAEVTQTFKLKALVWCGCP